MLTDWIFPNIKPPIQKIPSKHDLKPWVSILDFFQQQSMLRKSSMLGFHNLMVTFTLVFMITNMIINYHDIGKYVNPSLFYIFKQDFLLCLIVWPIFTIWSILSFFLQILIIAGLPYYVTLIIQLFIQVTPFALSMHISISRKWCISHTAFVTLQSCVHFLKMHSYTTANRDYRQEKQLSIKKDRNPLTPYPNNVNFKNYFQYLLMPVLVYQYDYIRLQKIRYGYLIKKMLAGIFTLLTIYLLYTDFILYNIHNKDTMVTLELLIRLIVPICFIIHLLFFLVFQCITSFFAQITRLADRKFYIDWWNSSHFTQFNRKWNLRVHQWLYRHIYLQLILRYKINKKYAQIATFLFSAFLHQFVLSMMFGSKIPIIIMFMMSQIPLFWITQSIKGKLIGQALFVFGIMLGPSLIMSTYISTTSVEL